MPDSLGRPPPHATCGSLSGQSGASRSLTANWRTWIETRACCPRISLPVTLAYGDDDWSHQAEQANMQATGANELTILSVRGHYSCLARPGQVAVLIEGVPR